MHNGSGHAHPVLSNTISDYHAEQSAALQLVRSRPDLLHTVEEALAKPLARYRRFRQETDSFLQHHFQQICTASCYRNQRSACCTRDGIVVFFADVLLNALTSTTTRLDLIAERLRQPAHASKCVFLASEGCLWQLKPIVCQMFLCDAARDAVFTADPAAARQWESFEAARKAFTWPDRPVLFDQLEALFLAAGLSSTLMHLHLSPGLLRVKRQSGLTVNLPRRSKTAL